MSLLINRSIKSPGVLILSVGGSLDASTSLRLEEEVKNALRGFASGLVFDFEFLKFISSAGLRIVIMAEKEMKKKNGFVLMMNLQPQIRKVFDIIKALPSSTVFSSTEELDDYLAKMQEQSLPI